MSPASARALLAFRRRIWPWCEDILVLILVGITCIGLWVFFLIFDGPWR